VVFILTFDIKKKGSYQMIHDLMILRKNVLLHRPHFYWMEFLATDFPVLYIYESEIRFGWDTKNKYSAKNSFNKIGGRWKSAFFFESMNHETQYVVRDLMYYWKWARANSLNIQLPKLTVIKINLSNEIQKFFSE